jgi:hypothetical protein
MFRAWSAIPGLQRRRRTRNLSLGLFALVVVLGTVALVAPGHSKPRARSLDSPFGGLAGYLWRGHVTSVQGSWAVPRIVGVAEARAGATTWIGAQAAGRRRSFIQVGDTEKLRLTGGHPRPIYQAFWSDIEHEYHAQALFAVHSGDRVGASMKLAHNRWTVTIADETSGRMARFTTKDEADAPFKVAEWMQEDPTQAYPVDKRAYAPYPRLTRVEFRRLAVNAKDPSYVSVYSAWMSVAGADWAPSPLRDDGFALRRATVEAVGRQYLDIAAREDAAGQRFGTRLEQSSISTPYAQLAAASLQLQAALHSFIGALASAGWPRRLRQMIDLVVRKTTIIIERAPPPAILSPSVFRSWKSGLTRDLEASTYTAHLLRREIGLPELA